MNHTLRHYLILLAAAAPACAAVVSVQPASLNTGVGQTIAVNVAISSVTDLFAFQLDLAFAPNLLSAVGVSEGAFLPSAGTTIFLPGTIDSAAGTISFNADTLAGAIPGASGSGNLLTVEFVAKAQGLSVVTISNLDLLNSQLGNIPASSQNGSILVAAPEPGSLVELSAGLSAMLLTLILRRTFLRGAS
jgi:hypothetical protein